MHCVIKALISAAYLSQSALLVVLKLPFIAAIGLIFVCLTILDNLDDFTNPRLWRCAKLWTSLPDA